MSEQKKLKRRVWAPAAIVLAAGAVLGLSAGLASANGPKESAGTRNLSISQPVHQPKPTVVLVHGAWADASSWSAEVRSLQNDGYTVRAIANPVENLTTDAEYVHDFLESINGPIVLVGHSYGGAVITNAAAGLPNVKALVYVDAAAPAPGETNGQLWASQRGASTAAFDTESKAAAWKSIPSWYFVSTGDQIITPTSELAMAHRAHSHITIFQGGSHLTLISHPDAVTAVIRSAISSVR